MNLQSVLRTHRFPRPLVSRTFVVRPGMSGMGALGQDDDDEDFFDESELNPITDIGGTGTDFGTVPSVYVPVAPTISTATLTAPAAALSPGSIQVGTFDASGYAPVYGVNSSGAAVQIGSVDQAGNTAQTPAEVAAAQQVAGAAANSGSSPSISSLTQATSSLGSAIAQLLGNKGPAVSGAAAVQGSSSSAAPGYTDIGGAAVPTAALWIGGGFVVLLLLVSTLKGKRR